MSVYDLVNKRMDYMVLKRVIGKLPSKQYIGEFECDCGEKVDRVIRNIFGNKVRKNPVSCGCKVITGRPKNRPKRKHTRTKTFDNSLANSFLKGSI